MISLRLANAADTPALEALIPLSARELQRDFYTPQQIEGALGTIYGVDSQLIADGTYFVVEAANTIVACGGWSRRSTLFGSDAGKVAGVEAQLDPAQDPARIRAFFVHPSWARRGIGGRIYAACEAAARAAGFRKLELVATLAGEPLYARFGFTKTQRYDLALPDGTGLPVVRMTKALD